ncbi:GAF domain-containing protein [Leadbettera azotonutricia]|nr:GAF domain-containing protein [Leadbettera azotonutricia]
MFEAKKETNPEANLALMVESVRAILEGETDLVAGLANASAALKFYLNDINWSGFYLLKGKDLVLGPFQGLPACARIAEGKGVCGKAVMDKKPVLVEDVHKFPGHIACDSASASELVIPLFRGGEIFGVLDLDSPRLARFTELEAEYLEQTGKVIDGFLDRVNFS